MTRDIAVLGGAGGIGRALVAALIAQGDRVAVLDLPASLARHPQPCAEIPVDATSEASVAEAMAAVAALWPGGMHGFVNLAGWNSEIRPVSDTPADYFDGVIEGNLRSAFLAARAASPSWRGSTPPPSAASLRAPRSSARGAIACYATCSSPSATVATVPNRP